MSRMQTLSPLRMIIRNIGSGGNFFSNAALSRIVSREARALHTSSASCNYADEVDDNRGFFRRHIDRYKFRLYTRNKLRPFTWLLYKDVMDRIDFLAFMRDFKMPDTYFSWFLITELHIWMLMTRLMAEGKEGFEMRTWIVEAMWEDANTRKKQLTGIKSGGSRKKIDELGYQFNAAIMGYDEGLLSHDRILAGAVWRRFLQCECNDPEQIERLVAYIRRTMIHLDTYSLYHFMKSRKIQWLDYKTILKR